MAPKVVRWFVALMVLIPAFSITAHALVFVTEENPPFNHTVNGKPAGMSTEIVSEIAHRAGVAFDVQMLEWQTAYQRGQADKDTCIYSMSRLANRERLFTWVGQIGVNKWAVFARNDFAKPVKTIADLRPFKIGGVAADSKVEFLRENAVTNIKEVAKDELNPPRLFLKQTDPDHIELWVTGQYAAADVAAKAKAGPIKLVHVIHEQPLWLACSPRTDRDSVNKLAAALAAMQKDGAYQRIVAGYEKKLAR